MVWLIGSKGLLGQEISNSLKLNNINFIETPTNITKIIIPPTNKIDYIINCAAYTKVDEAETNPTLAFSVNINGTENLAEIAKSLNATLIHFSTDYVFNGNKDFPYIEEDITDPLNVYGKSKEISETVVKNILEKYYIIRTSWLYGYYKNNFVYTILNLLNKNTSINVVDDQIGSPTWTLDLSNFILFILNNKIDYGTYHYSNEGSISWYEFATEIQKLYNIQNCQINKISSANYHQKAKRPPYSVLSKYKIRNAIHIPHWKESLFNFFKKDKNV